MIQPFRFFIENYRFYKSKIFGIIERIVSDALTEALCRDERLDEAMDRLQELLEKARTTSSENWESISEEKVTYQGVSGYSGMIGSSGFSGWSGMPGPYRFVEQIEKTKEKIMAGWRTYTPEADSKSTDKLALLLDLAAYAISQGVVEDVAEINVKLTWIRVDGDCVCPNVELNIKN